MTNDGGPSGPLDLPILQVIGQRGLSHRLVTDWAFRPDPLSPRRLVLRLDTDQYPARITDARLDVRWFEGGDYAFHYLESQEGDSWERRWDRHPKPEQPRAHVHPPPDAATPVEESDVDAHHHLGVLFAILDWVESRVATLHDATESS